MSKLTELIEKLRDERHRKPVFKGVLLGDVQRDRRAEALTKRLAKGRASKGSPKPKF